MRFGCHEVERGKVIGEVGVDSGTVGLCDEILVSAAVEELGEDDFSYLPKKVRPGAAIHELLPGAVLIMVASGHGDGQYPVYELLLKGELVGVEVPFVEAPAESLQEEGS